MERTIRNCIEDGLAFDEELNGIPMVLPGLIQAMALVLLLDTHTRLLKQSADVHINGNTFAGSPIAEPDLIDYVRVLTGEDLLRSTGQFVQLSGFCEWLLDQKEPEAFLWYSWKDALKKWNEYAALKERRDQWTF